MPGAKTRRSTISRTADTFRTFPPRIWSKAVLRLRGKRCTMVVQNEAQIEVASSPRLKSGRTIPTDSSCLHTDQLCSNSRVIGCADPAREEGSPGLGEHQERRLSLSPKPLVREDKTGQVY